MATRSHHCAAEVGSDGVFQLISRQLLLVPEAPLLLLLLSVHFMLGAPIFTALCGIVVVIWFSVRSLLLVKARDALDAGRYDRAGRLIGWSLAMHPYSADSFTLLSSLHLIRGRVDEADVAMRQAISHYPGRAMLYATMAGILLEAGHADKAREEAERALVCDDRCAPAYLHLAYALSSAGESLEHVEQVVRTGLASAPAPVDEAGLRCALAELLIQGGRIPEARLALTGAEQLINDCPTPQRASLYYHLGELRRSLGDIDEARSYFRASETLDPQGRYAAAAWRAARS